MEWQTIGAFVAATIILCVMPGPVMAIIAANTLKGGRAAGVLTVLGIGLGEATMLALTLASILASEALTPSLFPWVSLGGAAYLVWLAFSTLQPRQPSAGNGEGGSADRPFVGGLVIALCNPTALLFYTAFFMQFVDHVSSIMLQVVVLTATYLLTSITFDLGCVLFATCVRLPGARAPWFRKVARFACAVVYFGTSIAALNGFLTQPL